MDSKVIRYMQRGRNVICLGEAPKFFQGKHTETKHKIKNLKYLDLKLGEARASVPHQFRPPWTWGV